MRVQNEGTGKSSWWMLNPDAKPGMLINSNRVQKNTRTHIYCIYVYFLVIRMKNNNTHFGTKNNLKIEIH